MTEWVVAYGPRATGPEHELALPDLGMNFYRQGQPHELTGTLDARSEAGRAYAELEFDVWAYRDGQLVFRGPLMPSSGDETFDQSSHSIPLLAHSYRERLAHLYVPPRGYPNPTHFVGNWPPPTPGDAAQIAWELISVWTPISDLGGIVTSPGQDSGPVITPTPTIQPATAVDAEIDALAQMQMFDWDMVPVGDKVQFQAWKGQRGQILDGELLDFDENTPSTGSIVSGARGLDLSTFGNEVWLTTTTSGGQFDAFTLTAPYGPEGRWVIVQDAQDTDRTTTASRAQTALTAAQTPTPVYVLTMVPGWWRGPDHVWLGDRPQLSIRSGRINAFDLATVNQITIAVADGTENVSLTVGGKPRGGLPSKMLSIGRQFNRLLTRD